MAKFHPRQHDAIGRAIGRIFEDTRLEFLSPGGNSLRQLYRIAVTHEGGAYNPHTAAALESIAGDYLAALELKARAKTSAAAESGGFGAGELDALLTSTEAEVKRLVMTEAHRARSLGAVEGITRTAALRGEADPKVYFRVNNDADLCEECRRLHLNNDGTPRVWRLSEVSHGYHHSGDAAPSLGGNHPNCRCQIAPVAA